MSRWRQWPRTLAARVWTVAGAVSIRTKVLGILLSLILLLSLGVTVQVRVLLERTQRAHLKELSSTITHHVADHATDLILTNDLFALHQFLHDIQHRNEDVRYAFVLDPEGNVVAHSFDDRGFPMPLIGANPVVDGDHDRTVPVMTSEDRVWDTAVPVLDGRAGTARVGLTEASIERALTGATTQLLTSSLLVAAIGIIAGAGLTWLLTRPILELATAAKAVGKGDFSRRAGPWADDEIGELEEAFNSMTARLARAERAREDRDRSRQQLIERVILAQEEERKRIARELHDETSQALTSLKVGLRTLQDQCFNAEVQKRAEELRELAATTLDSVHDLTLRLRPSILDDLGLVAALKHHVDEYRQRYVTPVDFAARGLGEDRLPGTIETALYRIVQESLTNVARYADASSVSVLIERRDHRVNAIVEDDGCGFEPPQVLSPSDCLGLYGMQERVALLGGTFTVESQPGAGTSIHVKIPLETIAVESRSDAED
jgi:signal transduction histidine kinase